MPGQWRGNLHSIDVRDDFRGLFKFRVHLFLQEIVGVVLGPFVLMQILPRNAAKIADFVKSMTAVLPGIGPVCALSTFNPRMYGTYCWFFVFFSCKMLYYF